MNEQEPTITRIKRGQAAEWCPKCRLWVMPVGLGGSWGFKRIRWGCPNCWTLTEPAGSEEPK